VGKGERDPSSVAKKGGFPLPFYGLLRDSRLRDTQGPVRGFAPHREGANQG